MVKKQTSIKINRLSLHVISVHPLNQNCRASVVKHIQKKKKKKMYAKNQNKRTEDLKEDPINVERL